MVGGQKLSIQENMVVASNKKCICGGGELDK